MIKGQTNTKRLIFRIEIELWSNCQEYPKRVEVVIDVEVLRRYLKKRVYAVLLNVGS